MLTAMLAALITANRIIALDWIHVTIGSVISWKNKTRVNLNASYAPENDLEIWDIYLANCGHVFI